MPWLDALQSRCPLSFGHGGHQTEMGEGGQLLLCPFIKPMLLPDGEVGKALAISSDALVVMPPEPLGS